MEFALREKTVLLRGQFNNLTQSLMHALVADGADVAFIDPEAKKAEKFCETLSNQREINPKSGRAMAFSYDAMSDASIKDVIGNVARTYGAIEIFIDAQLENQKSEFLPEGSLENFNKLVELNLKKSLLFTQHVLGFMKSKKRGRILYLINDAAESGAPADALAALTRGGFNSFAKAIALQFQEFNITTNVLSLSTTEEFLMGHYPDAGAIKAALETHKKQFPMAKITDADKITNSILFLLGPSGAAISGQVIRA